MTIRTNLKFWQLQLMHANQICFINYGQSKEKTLTFAPLPRGVPTSTMKCGACGTSEMNATNFHNLVHFCPNREMEVFVTDFKAVEVKK